MDPVLLAAEEQRRRLQASSDLSYARKRPHVALEYEEPARAETVRVKQEFTEGHLLSACHFDQGHPAHKISHCAVKTEPYNGLAAIHPSCVTYPHTHQLYTHPSLLAHQPSLPHQTVHAAYHHFSPVKTSGTEFYNRSVCHYPEARTFPQVHTEQPVFQFSPWGLASPSPITAPVTVPLTVPATVPATVPLTAPVTGATFGSLAGVDMTQSLQEGSDLGTAASSPGEQPATSSRKGKSPRGPTKVKRELEEDDGWEPPLWRQQLQNIVKMRENRDAPVDLMGAHKNAEQATHVTPEVRRYQVLVSLMLSSQTKDQITAQAMQALKRHGLTIENIISTPEEEIAKLIHPVGFWRKKAGYIKRVSQILRDKYGGDIPATMDQLCSLPGVGPKMSHLVMDIAWDSISGVAVDTHVHRISHRLGWIRKPTENPEVTRICIEKWLPKSEWRELNWLFVGFGQQRCLPNAPKCKGCLNEDICPASKLKNGGPWGKKKRAVKKEPTESNST